MISRRDEKPTPEPAERHREFRLQRVLAMLNEAPERRLAIMTDGGSVPDTLILAVAIRGVAAFEMHMPNEKFDAFKLLWLIDQQGGAVTE